MKIIMALIAVSIVSMPVAAYAAATSSADPHTVCDGQLERLRISKIKPGGSVAGFLEAVAENNAWYAAHGLNGSTQVAARELKYDPATKSFSITEDEIATINVDPKGRGGIAEDAAWKAFVKKYDDNSEIVTDKWFCLPKTK